ncbi:MAG: amidohydrolase family protein [Acetobacteraceae bacterium]
MPFTAALAPAARGRQFVAETVAPERVPPLDPTAQEDLVGPADVILQGGPIVTMADSSGPADAVAVRAGRIQAVGRAEDVLACRGRPTRMIDLDGRTLLPGFINAHWHMNLDLLCERVDLPEDAPAEAACAAVVAAARAAASGEWIVLRGPARPPPAAALTMAAPSHPALCIDAAGAILAGNAAAAQLAAHISSLLPRITARLGISAAPFGRRFARMLRQAAAGGTTSLSVCGLGLLTGAGDLELLRGVAADAPPLRLRGMLDIGLLPEWHARGVVPGAGNDMLRLDAVSGWLAPPGDGLAVLATRLRAAREAGWQVTLHAADRVEVQVALDVMAQAGIAADPRSGIETRVLPEPAQTATLHERGLSLGLAIDAPGIAAPATSHPIPPDIPVSLGLDAVFGSSPPLLMLRTARGVDGPPLDLRRALAALTCEPARRCGTGSILGRIVRGAYADFALLDRDPRELDATGLTRLCCCGTWVNGIETFKA